MDFTNWSGRIFEQGRWVRYEIRLPSGGGWVSKGYHTHKGATLAMRAALKRIQDRHASRGAS